MNSNKLKDNVVDVSVGNNAVSSKTAAKIMISIVEFLLFNWNQIPLVFEQFRHMIEKLTEMRDPNELHAEVKNWKIERQRNEAIQAYQKYKELSEVRLQSKFSLIWQSAYLILSVTFLFQIVQKSFASNVIEQAIIMVGPTKFTSKACFKINFPKFSSTDEQSDSARKIQRQIIM